MAQTMIAFTLYTKANLVSQLYRNLVFFPDGIEKILGFNYQTSHQTKQSFLPALPPAGLINFREA